MVPENHDTENALQQLYEKLFIPHSLWGKIILCKGHRSQILMSLNPTYKLYDFFDSLITLGLSSVIHKFKWILRGYATPAQQIYFLSGKNVIFLSCSLI